MTDDGSYGQKGVVTAPLEEMIKAGEDYDLVITIGPLIMMKFVVKTTKPYNIPTTVSMNPIMIDGTGMCGGCRLTVDGQTKFACVDGPDFDGFFQRSNQSFFAFFQSVFRVLSAFDDYLPKPFEPRELLLRINNILRRVMSKPPEKQKAEAATERVKIRYFFSKC